MVVAIPILAAGKALILRGETFFKVLPIILVNMFIIIVLANESI